MALFTGLPSVPQRTTQPCLPQVLCTTCLHCKSHSVSFSNFCLVDFKPSFRSQLRHHFFGKSSINYKLALSAIRSQGTSHFLFINTACNCMCVFVTILLTALYLTRLKAPGYGDSVLLMHHCVLSIKYISWYLIRLNHYSSVG